MSTDPKRSFLKLLFISSITAADQLENIVPIYYTCIHRILKYLYYTLLTNMNIYKGFRGSFCLA